MESKQGYRHSGEVALDTDARMTRRHFLMLAAAMPLALGAGLATPEVAEAATTKSKIRAKYRKKVKALAKASYDGGEYYRFIDALGSTGEELIVLTRPDPGSGRIVRMYTYAGGKVKLVLEDRFGSKVGDNRFHIYKQGKGFVMERTGWGMEHFTYYKFSGGKYRMVLTKGRQSIRGGATENGPWGYTDKNGTSISAATFKKRVKSLAKGTCKKFKGSHTWSHMQG